MFRTRRIVGLDRLAELDLTRGIEVKFDRVNFSNVNTNGFALWEASRPETCWMNRLFCFGHVNPSDSKCFEPSKAIHMTGWVVTWCKTGAQVLPLELS